MLPYKVWKVAKKRFENGGITGTSRGLILMGPPLGYRNVLSFIVYKNTEHSKGGRPYGPCGYGND